MNTMNFNSTIGQETAALGYALLVGAVMGFYYDLFRIIRRIFRPGYAMILALDIFFWLTAAVGVFFGSVVIYGGQLRILFVAGVLAGWGLYAATIGGLLMAVIDGAFKVLGWIFRVIRRKVFSPAARVVYPLFKGAKRHITEFLYKKTENMVRKRKKEPSNQQIAS